MHGACAYAMKHARNEKLGRYGIFVPVSTFLSFAIVAVMDCALDTTLSSASVCSWDRRVPFLAAAPIGLIGSYSRISLDETPAFRALDGKRKVAHAI